MNIDIEKMEGIFAENSTPDKPLLTPFGALVFTFVGIAIAKSIFENLRKDKECKA